MLAGWSPCGVGQKRRHIAHLLQEETNNRLGLEEEICKDFQREKYSINLLSILYVIIKKIVV